MSTNVKAFMEYAEAFEQGFAADDWKLVDHLFAKDIIWSLAGPPPPFSYFARGREKVSAAIKLSVDSFDRRFDQRLPAVIEGPTAFPGGAYLKWCVTYSRAGLPAFKLLGEEWDLFHDGKMTMHHEVIHNTAELVAFLSQHHEQLLPVR